MIFFLKINDTHGHLSGDTVLREVAAILQQNIRKDDFVARYGGEEFVMVLNDINQHAASEILDKIRTRIEQNPFILKDEKVHITISVGYTSINDNDIKESAFSRADNALYQAKEGGRNQLRSL